ncbi:hypothetical protein J2045_002992 [Peteryoungia aggregata LMG 23059]|uniref:Uncharacterized protein n=1 Tax=Peteryoungia aggregata LMG 23059 TaxID=1368425 RepID=A0ABU0G9G9_9HYPH|nr:hypothetical protein [Peteryoungia aggregata LMG 23059]
MRIQQDSAATGEYLPRAAIPKNELLTKQLVALVQTAAIFVAEIFGYLWLTKFSSFALA